MSQIPSAGDWMRQERPAIVNLLGAYHFHGDGGDPATLAALFAEEGELRPDGARPCRGRSEIEAFVRRRQEARRLAEPGAERSRHHTSSIFITPIDESNAEVSSYFQLLTPRGMDHWGSYRDQVIKHRGEWRFWSRSVVVDGQSASSWRRLAP
jgi:hypothetical protein